MVRQLFYLLLLAALTGMLSACPAIKANKPDSEKDGNRHADVTSSAVRGRRSRVADAIFFLNEKEGWAICSEFSLCHTEDGGQTWKVITHKGLKFATAVYFVNAQVGYAIISEWIYTGHADTRAYLMQTQDGGTTWHKKSEVADADIYSLTFFDAKRGYITCKYVTLQTQDSGETWSKIEIKPTNENEDEVSPTWLTEGLVRVVFLSENVAWGYKSGIWRSDDGGKTWDMRVTIFDVAALYNSCFVDDKNGWMVGSEEQIWHMNDGQTWNKINIPETLSSIDKSYPRRKYGFVAVDFVSSQEGWIVREDGSLFYTADEGATWQVIYKSEKEVLGSILFLDSQHGFALSDKSEFFFTNDGGHSWKIQPIINPYV